MDRFEEIKVKLEGDPDRLKLSSKFPEFLRRILVEFAYLKLDKNPLLDLAHLKLGKNFDCEQHIKFLGTVYNYASQMNKNRKYSNKTVDDFINHAIVLCKNVYKDDGPFVSIASELLKLKDENLRKPPAPTPETKPKTDTTPPISPLRQFESMPTLSVYRI